jgi:hypothetical protein
VISLVLILALIGLPLSLGFWIWGMVDGYRSAGAFNRKYGIGR